MYFCSKKEKVDNMIVTARHIYILERLNEQGLVDYKSIATELDISEATVRRDFEKLETQGKLKRVQGGAIGSEVEDALEVELTMESKHDLNSPEKQAIAREAAKLVKAGQCVFLDSGTTLVPLAKLLTKKDVQIVTYNSLILQNLFHTDANLIILGGQYSRPDSMFYGPIAEHSMKQFYFDHTFIGCSGVDLTSRIVFSTGMEERRMKRISMENSNKVSLLMDSSKFNKRGFLKVASFEDFNTIYCTLSKEKENISLPDNFKIVKTD